MNKKSIQKLSLFLTGLEQRLLENKEYFKKASIIYQSGTKEFIAVLHLKDDKMAFNFNGRTDVIEIQWLSARVSKLSSDYDAVKVIYEERGTTLIIDADDKNVKMSTKAGESEEQIKQHEESAHIGNRDYLIKVGQADDLLKEIGVMGANGKIKNNMIRKYNQIDHFVELISPMIEELAQKYEVVNILDCGCGKSYLTFVLNYYVKEVLKKPCHFIGLDYSVTVIDASKRMAAHLGYHNMTFKTIDIKDYKADREIHMVISLHACDTATDQAIALALNNASKAMVIVPCCHSEFLNQYTYAPFEDILKHGIFKARLADLLTDGMRMMLLESAGYKTSVVEYISPLETPKNLMIRAEKIENMSPKAQGAKKKMTDSYRQMKQMFSVEPSLEKLIHTNNVE